MKLLWLSLLALPAFCQAPSKDAPAAQNPPSSDRSVLEVKPGEDLKTVRAQEDAILKSYAWADPDKGIVRIPIDRAIEIVAARGLPARAAKSVAATDPNAGGGKKNVKSNHP